MTAKAQLTVDGPSLQARFSPLLGHMWLFFKAIFSNFGFSNGNVVKLRHFTAKATGGTGGSNSAVDAIGTFLTLDHGTVEAIGNASSYGLSLDTHDPAEIVNSNITADDATGDNIGLYTSNGGTAIVKITNSQMRGQSGQDARGAYLRGCGLNAQSSVFIGINGTMLSITIPSRRYWAS